MPLRVKHVSEIAAPSDGTRVLVDRLWPRGRAKASLPHDQWLRDIAPSTGLRQWFRHDPGKWAEFQRRYTRELSSKTELVAQLRSLAGKGTVTLLFGASDRLHNNAVALAAIVSKRRAPPPSSRTR